MNRADIEGTLLQQSARGTIEGCVVIQGPSGKPLTFDDLTAEQKKELTGPEGPQGVPGEPGEDGTPGPKGDPGESGVYLGAETPPEDYSVWIDPSGEASGIITKEEVQQMINTAISAITDLEGVKF